MRYVAFGTRRVKVSEVILGLMRIGEMTPTQVAELVQTGLDAGVNALDTADIYGDGLCEEILGDTFAANRGLRDRVWLQTKAGIRRHEDPTFTYFDFSKEHIIEGVNASLKRLQTDHVDSLLLHRPDVLMVPEEVADAFQTLHDQGKVLDFGVSNQNPALMGRLQHYIGFPLVVNQVQLSVAFAPAFESAFNVNMENDASPMRDGGIFEYACLHDQVIQAWSVMQHGYFQGVFLGDPSYAALNESLERIAGEHDTSPTAVAIAWVLRHPAKMQAVIGTTKPERVRLSAAACDFELTREEWYELYLAAGRQLP